MLDLKERVRDIRALVEALELVIIDTLATFGVEGHIRPGRVGVWVEQPSPNPMDENKIAAIGIKVRSWVTFHGLSLNIAPELEHFSGIVACGQTQFGVTSLKALGIETQMTKIDEALRCAFMNHFGPLAPSETLSAFMP